MLTTILTRRPERRATIQDPSVPLTASNIVEFLGYTNEASSGMPVTRKTVLGMPAIWRGVNLISDAVATAPVHVYKRLPGGGKERDRSHPAYNVLRHEPHPEISDYVFYKTMQAHALLEGAAYAYITREPSKVYLTILDPGETYPVRVDGQLMYITKWANDDGRKLERKMWPQNVLHIRGLAWDGLTAYRLMDILRDAFGLPLAAQRYGGRFFANDARPGVVVEVPYRFPDQEAAEKFRERFGELHQGVDNASRPAILEAGGKISLLGGNNQEAQFLETRKFETRQLAVILGLPPHLLGDDSRTSFASLEQENKATLMHGINPWLVQWEAEMRSKMLSQEEKRADSHTVKFERKAFIAVDRAAQATWYQMALMHQTMVPNEVREQENLNPVPWGDDPLPLPNASISSEPPPPDAAPPPDEPESDDDDDRAAKLRDAQQTVLRNALEYNLRRASHQIRQAAKRPKAFLRWLDEELHAKNYAVFLAQLQPAVRAYDLLEHGSTQTDTGKVVGVALDKIRSELLEMSGQVTAEELPARADAYCETLEAHCHIWMLDHITAAR